MYFFVYVCMRGHIETAKYIMSLAETYSDINPAAQNNAAFRFARGHMDTIRYLLTLSDVRTSICKSSNDYIMVKKWIQLYAKKIIVRWIVFKTWRIESVTRVFCHKNK